MHIVTRAALAATALAGTALLPAAATAQQLPDRTRLSVMSAKIASMEAEITRFEDVQAIKRLQSAYGYYRSKGMADDLAALFADDPDSFVEIGGRGRYFGQDSIRKFFAHESNQVEDGEIRNYILAQGVVHVADDGKTAKGRWRALIQAGTYGEDGKWIEGPYENEYVKEDGVWKFSKVHWYQTMAGSYDKGWHQEAFGIEGPLEDLPPDQPPSDDFKAYPDAYFKPFHYDHPVTGKPVYAK